MGGAFALYASQWFMIGTWLPSFAVTYMEFSLGQASLLTGLVMLTSALGNLAAPYLASVGFSRWQVIAAGQVLTSGFGFVVFSSGVEPELRMLAAVAASIAGGTIPGTVMAGIPVHARDASEVALGNGIVVQCIMLAFFLDHRQLQRLLLDLVAGMLAGGYFLLFAALVSHQLLCSGVLSSPNLELRRKRTEPPDTNFHIEAADMVF